MTRLLICALLIFPTMAQSADFDDGNTVEIGLETEEVTYEDLVNELAARRRRLEVRPVSAFDDVRIHAGFGMINSFSTFNLEGRSVSRYQNGLQLSAGVDLFSPNWFAETAWRNFGLTRNGAEEHTLREIDLKFGHRDRMKGPWQYRLQVGLADRYLKLTDPTRNLKIDETSPSLLGSLGAAVEVGPNASVTFDASVRSPVVGGTTDRGSIDFGIDFKVSL